jgi:hypothetical protein
MGLDAVVYKNLKNVAIQVEQDALIVDRITGEPYFKDDDIAQTLASRNISSHQSTIGKRGDTGTDS